MVEAEGKAAAPKNNAGSAAVDRVMELLKTTDAYMPNEENIRPVLHSMLTARKQNWPQLRAFLKENPERESEIRAELTKAFADRRRH